MLFGYVDKLLRHFMIPQHIGAVRHMGNDNVFAQSWRKLVMRVINIHLVFYKILGPLCLADIMVIGADPCQRPVCSDRFACRLR